MTLGRNAANEDLTPGNFECLRIQRLLPAYLDGELASEEIRLVSLHLLSCENCKKVLEEEKRLNSLLQSLPEAPPGSILSRTLAAKDKMVRKTRMVRAAAGLAASVAILITLFFLTGRSDRKPQEEALIAHLPIIQEVDALVQAGGEDLLQDLDIVEAVYELSWESYSDVLTGDDL